jgi:WG containing repeat
VWDYLHVMTVDSGTLEEDGKSIFVGQGGKEILSPWVRVKLGEKVSILQLNGQPAVPESLAGAEYVDFYGTQHVVITQPLGADGKLWSLYEPGTGKQTKFPDAATFRWNWNEVAAGALWMKDKTTARWHLMHMDGSTYGHSQPEAEKPDGWGFIEGRGLLHKAEGWHFIDPAGKDISPERWEEARNFSEGLAAVRRAGKWGFMDLDGKWAIPSVWEEVGDFSRGLAAVRRGAYWGYLDTRGTLAIEPVWDEANAFRPWKGEPGPDGKVPVLDVAEVKMKGFTYDAAGGRFSAHRAVADPFAQGKQTAPAAAALIDRSGRLIVEPASWNLWEEDFGYVVSRHFTVNTYSDENIRKPYAEVIVKWQGTTPNTATRSWRTRFDTQVPVYSPALGWKQAAPEDGVWRRGLPWQLVDETGKPLTEAVWNEPYYSARMDEFAPGLIHARSMDQKYGLLRKDGSLVVPAKFDRIAWVATGVAAAWSSTEGGLLDTNGKWVFQDNDKIRIARFGADGDRTTGPQHRHGLIIIEDTPEWGYARLNR